MCESAASRREPAALSLPEEWAALGLLPGHLHADARAERVLIGAVADAAADRHAVAAREDVGADHAGGGQRQRVAALEVAPVQAQAEFLAGHQVRVVEGHGHGDALAGLLQLLEDEAAVARQVATGVGRDDLKRARLAGATE